MLASLEQLHVWELGCLGGGGALEGSQGVDWAACSAGSMTVALVVLAPVTPRHKSPGPSRHARHHAFSKELWVGGGGVLDGMSGVRCCLD